MDVDDTSVLFVSFVNIYIYSLNCHRNAFDTCEFVFLTENW